jgi:hypothetical protein
MMSPFSMDPITALAVVLRGDPMSSIDAFKVDDATRRDLNEKSARYATAKRNTLRYAGVIGVLGLGYFLLRR